MAYLRACLMKRAVDHHRNREHELQVLLHRVVPRGRPGGKRTGIAESRCRIDMARFLRIRPDVD